MRSPRKILAIKLRSLGDTLLMLPALEQLRQAYPSAELHVAATRPWSSILEGQLGIKKVWHYDRYEHRPARAKAIARLGVRLRRQHFDWVINFHASPSSSLLAFTTGARVRAIHFHGHKDRNQFSTVEIPGKSVVKPIIERDLDVVRALGITAPEGLIPKLNVDASAQAAAQRQIELGQLRRPLLGIGLGASRESKQWPIERFAEVARRWVDDTGGSAIALGGPDEIRFAQAFKRDAPQAHILFGKSMPELVGITSALSCLVGNDSGPRHLALALGIPTVTLFGPEDPFEWHPYSVETHPRLYVEGLPCRRDALPGYPPWCGRDRCSLSDAEAHRCMRDHTVDQVMTEVLRVRKYDR